METQLTLTPIGIFHCDKKWTYDTASQPHLDRSQDIGVIELATGQQLELAARDLQGMSHAWIVFWFHQNNDWRPLVTVPRGSTDKVSVLASRSPHRPNPIGLSLVEVVKVDGRKIWIRKFDLIDQTPILDIKPYHPEADVADNARTGWLENLNAQEYNIVCSDLFLHQAEYLRSHGVNQIKSFAEQQLRFDPFNSSKKRVNMLNAQNGVLAYRTWRVRFSVLGTTITLEEICSGYSEHDLTDANDRWQDKALHRSFTQVNSTDISRA